MSTNDNRIVGTVNFAVTLGEKTDLLQITDFVRRDMRVTHVRCNVPCPEFMLISSIRIDGREIMREFTDAVLPRVDAFVFNYDEDGARLGTEYECRHGFDVDVFYTGCCPSFMTRDAKLVVQFAFLGVELGR